MKTWISLSVIIFICLPPYNSKCSNKYSTLVEQCNILKTVIDESTKEKVKDFTDKCKPRYSAIKIRCKHNRKHLDDLCLTGKLRSCVLYYENLLKQCDFSKKMFKERCKTLFLDVKMFEHSSNKFFDSNCRFIYKLYGDTCNENEIVQRKKEKKTETVTSKTNIIIGEENIEEDIVEDIFKDKDENNAEEYNDDGIQDEVEDVSKDDDTIILEINQDKNLNKKPNEQVVSRGGADNIWNRKRIERGKGNDIIQNNREVKIDEGQDRKESHVSPHGKQKIQNKYQTDKRHFAEHNRKDIEEEEKEDVVQDVAKHE